MEKEELTLNEQATLLAHVDVKLRSDYDEPFYSDLCNIAIPVLDKISDRIRRAIIKYVTTTMWDVSPELDNDTKFLAALTEALLKGYELGRKRKRPITRG